MPVPTRRAGGLAACLVLASALALALVAAPATAKERSNTVSLDPGSSKPIGIDFQDAPAMNVEYDVQVDSGPNIDLLVMDNANYQKYDSGDSFKYVSTWSVLDTGSATQEFTLEEHGTWWIVLDHTSDPENGAQPATVNPQSVTASYTITTKVNVQESVNDGIAGLPAPGGPAAMASLLAAGLVLRRR